MTQNFWVLVTIPHVWFGLHYLSLTCKRLKYTAVLYHTNFVWWKKFKEITYHTTYVVRHPTWVTTHRNTPTPYAARSLDAVLTHWGRDKMAAVSQTTFSNAFSWMKMFEFRLKFDWSVFPRVQLTIFQHWFRWWLGAVQATSNYLNQWWIVYRRIYASLGLNELTDSPNPQLIVHIICTLYWVRLFPVGEQ